ncbi:MAG TPA: ABC transporter permease [Candidatus Limnocylindrales bacterium]
MTTVAAEATTAQPVARDLRVPRHGWLVIARKEFGDHILSARFLVLVLVVGLAAIVPLFLAANQLRDQASQTSGASAIFLALFTLGSEQVAILRVDAFVGIVAPLLGIAFAFDAVNGERSDGTLPRLMSQPIHRDDVINGKFVAGLAVIALVLAAVLLLISGIGIFRLGIIPTVSEVIRLIVWYVVTLAYVSFWLALGLLLSVAVRRAATSALIGFGLWILVTVFGGLIVGLIGGLIAPSAGGLEEQIASAQTQQAINHILPHTLYREATTSILFPFDQVTAAISGVGSFTPTSIDQLGQATDQRRITSLLSLDQSLLLVWPQIVGLIALTVICFAVAYVLFMRQEVRA